MSANSSGVIAIFFVRALFCLFPLLALWYWARDWVVQPVAWLAEQAMVYFFSRWAVGSELHGVSQTLLTVLTVPHASGRVADLTPETVVLTYCYGLPLLVALFVAARAKGLWWKLPLCAVAMMPFQAWGVCFAWLVQVAVHAGEFTRAKTYFSSWDQNLIVLGYQFGFLLMPTLVPLLLWLFFERRFVITVAVEGAMQGSVVEADR
ncbi:MAG: hypothetical protein HEQ39_18270 [Rhizobacter sp.]